MIFLLGTLIFDILVTCLGNLLPKKRSIKIIEIILFVLPVILLCSLKSINIGNDTFAYYTSYNESITDSVSGFYTGDKGFLLLEFIFKSIGTPFFVFLLVCYTIVFGGLALFAYKKSENPLLVLLFVTYFGLFGFAISALRQAIAIGLLLIGFSFFDENKPISILSPLIFTVIATFIHKTSFFGFLVALILLIRFSKKSFKYLVLCLLCLIVVAPFVYSGVVILIKSSYYPNYENTAWTLLFYSLFVLLSFLLTNEYVVNLINKLFGKLDNSAFLGKISFKQSKCEEKNMLSNFNACILYPLFVLSIGVYNSTFARVYYYLIPFTALFITDLMNKKEINLFTRCILNALLILFLVGYFVYAVIIKNPLNVAQYSIGPIF